MEEFKGEQRESVKLTKGMTDKYSWEIKLLGKPEELVDRLMIIDKDIENKLKGGKCNESEK